MNTQRDWNAERAAIAASAAGRETLIVQSHALLTGTALVPGGGDAADMLWNLPTAVVAHGTEADPLFFYANRAALALFDTSAARFIGMPSRLSAPPASREERARFMARVTQSGFVSDYAGLRISASGARFTIEGATVWNLIDSAGVYHGQAAHIPRWQAVD